MDRHHSNLGAALVADLDFISYEIDEPLRPQGPTVVVSLSRVGDSNQMLLSQEFSTCATWRKDFRKSFYGWAVATENEFIAESRRTGVGGGSILRLRREVFRLQFKQVRKRAVGEMEPGNVVARMVCQFKRRQNQLNRSRIGQWVSTFFTRPDARLLERENQVADFVVGSLTTL